MRKKREVRWLAALAGTAISFSVVLEQVRFGAEAVIVPLLGLVLTSFVTGLTIPQSWRMSLSGSDVADR